MATSAFSTWGAELPTAGAEIQEKKEEREESGGGERAQRISGESASGGPSHGSVVDRELVSLRSPADSSLRVCLAVYRVINSSFNTQTHGDLVHN